MAEIKLGACVGTGLGFWLLRNLILAACVVGGVLLGSIPVFGTVSGLPRFLAGERLLIEEPVRDLGQLRRGSRVVVKVRLFNPAFSQVVVAESRTSCSCTLVQKLPLAVPARSTINIEVFLDMPQQVGIWTQQFQLNSEMGNPLAAEVRLIATLVESASNAVSLACL